MSVLPERGPKPFVKPKPIALRSANSKMSQQRGTAKSESFYGQNLFPEYSPPPTPVPRYEPHEFSAPSLGDPFVEASQHHAVGGSYEESGSPQPHSNLENATRLVLAIDFGTTFTGVAFATPEGDTIELSKIEVVREWGQGMENSAKIPSVISYSLPSLKKEQQWGFNLSPNAVAMVNTKLLLDTQDDAIGELELIIHALDGMKDLAFDNIRAAKSKPEFTWKKPELIATDYFSKLFRLIERKLAYIPRELLETLPVDMVITTPVQWSYQAKNSTYRSITNGGFNSQAFPRLRDVVLVTEPEVAALYTARYLREKKGDDMLRREECFILVDAGGGTVVSILSNRGQLYGELTRSTGRDIISSEKFGPYQAATGEKCGSIYIDRAFKTWLRDKIGKDRYLKLDPGSVGRINAHTTEGAGLREIMAEFDRHKRKFTGEEGPMKIHLPDPLGQLTVPGRVNQGFLTITTEEMKDFFMGRVNAVVDLIQDQCTQIEMLGTRVRNVFMIGGFGESKFLRSEVDASLDMRGIKSHKPPTSWTAVVQGAVMYGVEKDMLSNFVKTKVCDSNYGVLVNEPFSEMHNESRDYFVDKLTNAKMARQQLLWPVKRGDLILPDDPEVTEILFAFNFEEQQERKFRIKIFEYSHEDNFLPTRYQTASEELESVIAIDVNLSESELNDFDRYEADGRYFYQAVCVLKLGLGDGVLEFQVAWNGQQVFKDEKPIKVKEVL